MNLKFNIVLILIGLVAGCHPSPMRPESVGPGDYSTVEAYLTNKIGYELDRANIAGLSIALVDDQEIIWARGFGYADHENGLPATADTRYRVGSISKLFTVAAVLQLVEAGKLDLDQPIQDWLPELSLRSPSGRRANITIRQLMTHHAGLARDRVKGSTNSDARDFSGLVREIAGETIPHEPGEIFSYSNLGMALLGEIVQRASGRPFAAHLQDSLLDPLGMRSAVFESHWSPHPGMALGYRGRKAATEIPLRDVPAGGLTASALDLAHFLHMVFAEGRIGSNVVLRSNSVAEMFHPQNANVPLDLNFRVGLGWMLSSLGSEPIPYAGVVAHHAGATHFFRSQIYVLPELKLGVIVLANSSTASPAVDMIAREALGLAIEAKQSLKTVRSTSKNIGKPVLSAAEMSRFPGTYTTVSGLVHITARNDVLHAEWGGNKFKLQPKADGSLGLSYALLGLIDIDLGPLARIGFARRTLMGREVLIARDGEQELLVGERLPAATPEETWKRRLGDYRIVNLQGDWEFAKRIRLLEEHGHLAVEVTMTEPPGQVRRAVLRPLSVDESLLLGPLADRGDRLKVVVENGQETLLVSGYRLERLP